MIEEALKQGMGATIVVALYLIVTRLIDIKNKNKNVELTNNITNSVNTISLFLNTITKNIIDNDKEKAKVAIKDSFSSAALNMCYFITNTIVNNHILENKTSILSNSKIVATAEYYGIYNTLAMYYINNKKINEYMNTIWIDEIDACIISVIYNDNLTSEEKIISFHNIIDLKIQNYITYLLNHTFK